MSKMFVIYDLKTDFEKAKSEIDPKSIVFIKDTRQIYTHGIFFSDQTTVDTILNGVYTKAQADEKFAPKSNVYTKSETDAKIATATGSIYRVKGTVADAAALAALTDVVVGDTYNVTTADTLDGVTFEAGSNFVATKAGAGDQPGMWDKLGGTIDLSGYIQSGTLGNYVPKSTKVNAKDLSGDITLSGADITLAGYSATSGGKVAATDTVNNAVKKLDEALCNLDWAEVSAGA